MIARVCCVGWSRLFSMFGLYNTIKLYTLTSSGHLSEFIRQHVVFVFYSLDQVFDGKVTG